MTSPAREFDRYAPSYQELLDRSVRLSGDTGEYFCEYKAQYVARAVGADFTGTILDYGCGVGLLAARPKTRLPRAVVHGYDPSGESIARIPPDLAAAGRFTDTLRDLDSGYQLAILSNVMHHVAPPQRAQAIAEIAARLGPGGHLFLFEHNPWNPLTRWVVRHCPFDEGVRLLPPREAVGYVSRAGLAVRRREFIVFFPRMLAALRPLEASLGWLPAGAQYAVVGEKHAG